MKYLSQIPAEWRMGWLSEVPW